MGRDEVEYCFLNGVYVLIFVAKSVFILIADRGERVFACGKKFVSEMFEVGKIDERFVRFHFVVFVFI